MSTQSIVVWSHSLDTAADRVEAQLRVRGASPIRVNIDEYGRGFRLSSNALQSTIHSSTGSVSLDSVAAIYYRRPFLTELPEDSRDFVAHEAWYFSRCVLLQMPGARWMNFPPNVQHAENKLLQLSIATEFGLTVPRSALVASAAEAFEFYSTCEGCVCKPGFAGTVAKPVQLSVYAKELDRDLRLHDFEPVAIGPTFLQELVRKRADIRLTQVGEKGLAVRIYSPDGVLDWRSKLDEGLRYEVFSPPAQVMNRVRRMMKHLGLSFGALDFAEAADGEWVFLEINPAGQWEWLEVETDVPISDSIASWLMTE